MTLITIILTVAGAATGFLTAHFFGLFYGGFSGLFLGLVIGLRHRISKLENAYDALRAALPEKGDHQAGALHLKPASPLSPDRPADGFPAGADGFPAGADRLPPSFEEAPPETIQSEPADDLTFTFDTEISREETTPPPLPKTQPPFPGQSAFSERFDRFLTTTNIVVGVGLIVLFFGVAFLLKFAIERGMLPLEVRYAGVGILGAALLVIGWFFRKHRRDFALLLQGGAMGILYITVFSAARWHQLIPLPMAFFIMVGLVVLSGLLAVFQNARGLAAFAATGGFLAPVLTSTGDPDHIFLFTYYALLGAGIFGMAFFKAWRELNLIGFGFTLCIGGLWGLRYYRPELLRSSEFFLILFFLLYLTISILFAVRQTPKLKGLVDGTLVFGLPIAAFGLQAGLVGHITNALAWSALALGVFYLLLTVVLRLSGIEYMRRLVEAFLALGILFASLAVPLAFDARWTAASWAIEGAALVWIGIRQNRLPARCFGLLLIFLAGLAAVPEFFTSRTGPPILNGVFLGYLMVAVSALFSSQYLKRNPESLSKWERPLHAVYLAWGLTWWYLAGMTEIAAHIGHYYYTSAVVCFLAASALIWSFLQRRLAWTTLKYIIFCLAPALVLIILGQRSPFSYWHPFGHLGYLAWPFAILTQFILLGRHENDIHRTNRLLQHVAALCLAAFILTREAVWGMSMLTHDLGSWQFAAWGFCPALLVAILVIFEKRLPWPVNQNRQAYLGVGGPILLTCSWLWLIYGSFTHPGDAWPFRYIVLLNPLELTQLLVVASLLAWYRSLGKKEMPVPLERRPKWAPHLLSGTLFVLANTVLARAIHHWNRTPWDFDALWGSMVFQAAVSIFWTALALSLMATATRKAWRGPWFAGGTLLAAVVVKLFLVDLSQTGTISRIISFIAVGLIMLLIGYLSPLPPRIKEKATE